MLKTNSKHIHVSIPDWLPKVTFLDFESLGISSEDDLPNYLPDDIKDKLQDGAYFRLDEYGDIIGVTSVSTEIFYDDDEDYLFDEDDDDDDELLPEDSAISGLKSKYSVPSVSFASGAKLNTKPQVIVDVDYVADLLQGLESQELKYISKVCEMLIAEGEL